MQTTTSRRFQLGAPLRAIDALPNVRAQSASLETSPAGTKIQLCLSGGGIRAALFHLGVLYYLSSIDRLKDVERVSSVSGGSILAAHFALRHEQYLKDFRNGADDKENQHPAFDFAKFAASDLRGFVFRRWIGYLGCVFGLIGLGCALVWRMWDQIVAPYGYYWIGASVTLLLFVMSFFHDITKLVSQCSRTRLLQSGYDRFLSRHLGKMNAMLSTLPAKDVLDLEILSTSLSTGVPISFNRAGITIHSLPSVHAANTTFSVSRAITASSAFPAAFPPICLSKVDDFLLDADSHDTSDHYVGDGGIFDNLGICNMVSRLSSMPSQTRSYVIISDAGLPFQGDPPGKEQGFNWVTNRAIRSTDIQMNRLALLDSDDATSSLKKTHPNIEVMQCSISDQVSDSDVSQLEVKIRTMRTDLNSFSPAEIHVLVRHGFNVARKKCSSHLGTPIETQMPDRWSPLDNHTRETLLLGENQPPELATKLLFDKLADSHRRRFGFLNWSDRLGIVVFLLPWFFCLSILAVIYFRFELPVDLPQTANKMKEPEMMFTDWRELYRSYYKEKSGTLCYFEMPISGYYRGRVIKTSYEKEQNIRSVIEVHALLITTDRAIHELQVDSKDGGKLAEIHATECNRGDVLVFFIIVTDPIRDFFTPFKLW